MDVQAPATDLKGIFFQDFDASFIPHILKEIYIDRVYVPYLMGRKNLTIVDWGANIGLTAQYFSNYAQKVYAVEPSARHLIALRYLINFNKLSNVVVCPYAISNVDGKTKFYHNDNVTMYSLKDTVNNKADFEEVETVTVDTFLKREKIDNVDFLKLDLEGFESEVVTSKGFKDNAEKIQTILGEWHQWTAMSKPVFQECLESYGYTFEWIAGPAASIWVATRL